MNCPSIYYAYALTPRNALITDSLWLAVRRLALYAAGAWRSFHAARQRRNAIRQLNTLEDRLLRDIGITRDQIPEAVEGLLKTKVASSVGTRLPAEGTNAARARSVRRDAANDNRFKTAA